jgi:hypothetical protein
LDWTGPAELPRRLQRLANEALVTGQRHARLDLRRSLPPKRPPPPDALGYFVPTSGSQETDKA